MPSSLPHQRNWRRGIRLLLVALVTTSMALPAVANPLNLGQTFRSKLKAIDDALRLGDWESYLTGYAWHLPHGYQESTRARLNETTWGGGFGRTIKDDDGDRHSVYVMGFSDSHRAAQFNIGYAWQRYWKMTRNVELGAGYLAFLFSREDVANHLPMPALLPCASMSYRGIELI